MQLELLEMLDADHVALAAGYAAASVAAGFLAVALATNLVRRARLARMSALVVLGVGLLGGAGGDRPLPARRRGQPARPGAASRWARSR